MCSCLEATAMSMHFDIHPYITPQYSCFAYLCGTSAMFPLMHSNNNSINIRRHGTNTSIQLVFSVVGQGLHRGKEKACKQSLKFFDLPKSLGITQLSFLVSFTVMKMLLVVWPSEGSLTQPRLSAVRGPDSS